MVIQLCSQRDFCGSAANVIHPSNPLHLVVCFELFRHALTLCKLPYQLIKHILRLLVDIGKISGQLAFGQQICVENITVTLQIAKMPFPKYADFHFWLFGQF